MSRTSPVPMLEPNEPTPFINEGVMAPEPVYPGDPQLDRSQTSLNRSRTSLHQSTGSLHQLQPVDTKPVSKDKKASKEGGGSLGKLKGKFFKKKSKAAAAEESPQFADGVENPEDPYDDSPNPYATSYGQPAAPFSAAPPPPPPPPVLPSYPTRNMEIMEMKPAPPKSKCRSGNVLNVMLIGGFVLGIILCACIPADSDLLYVGPVLLGLSMFAFCGKVFFTLFWEEDPVPWANPYLAKLDKYIGPAHDPYGLERSSATSKAAYVGPMFSGAGLEMGAMGYSTRPPPVMSATGTGGYSTTPFTSGAVGEYGRSTPIQNYGGNITPQYGGNTPTQQYGGSSTPTQQYGGRSTPQQYSGDYGGSTSHYATVADPYTDRGTSGGGWGGGGGGGGGGGHFFSSDVPAGASTPTPFT